MVVIGIECVSISTGTTADSAKSKQLHTSVIQTRHSDFNIMELTILKHR